MREGAGMNASDFVVSIHREFRVQDGRVVELSGFVETAEHRYRFECFAELSAIFDRERRAVYEVAAQPHATQL
jgi:hypothetical protein